MRAERRRSAGFGRLTDDYYPGTRVVEVTRGGRGARPGRRRRPEGLERQRRDRRGARRADHRPRARCTWSSRASSRLVLRARRRASTPRAACPRRSTASRNLTLGARRPGFVPAEGGRSGLAGAARAPRRGRAARPRRLQLNRAAALRKQPLRPITSTRQTWSAQCLRGLLAPT